MKKTTDELLEMLNKSKDIKKFFLEQREEMPSYSLSEYLELLLSEKGTKKSEIIKSSGIEKSYFYQILKGRKSPSRNKILMLAFGMKLDLNETRRLLKVADVGDLYVKNQRDAAIVYALLNGFSLIDANILLDELSFEIIE